MIVKINGMKDFISKNFQAFIFALLVGCITSLPQLLIMHEPGYRGIAITGSDSEEYYNGRVREVYDGHYSIANHDLYEYKNKPYVQTPLPEIMVAIVGRILGISAAQIVSFGKFLFPFLLYLILYLFVRGVTENTKLSIAVPAAIILASNLIFFPADILKLFSSHFGELHGINLYSRPINPQISSLIFFIWVYVFYKWLKNKSHILYIFSVLLLGLFFYVYIYSWMLAYVLIALLIFISFFNKRMRQYFPLQKLLLMLALSFILSIPFWINYYALQYDPWYGLLQKHYGFYKTYAPIWSDLLLVDFVILFLLYRKKNKDLNFYIFLSIFLSLYLVINQQVITGIRFFPGHWHWYYTTPFSILLFLWYTNTIILKYHLMFSKIFLGFIIIFSFLNSFIKQNNLYYIFKEDLIYNQKYADVFGWLDTNTNNDDVVLTHGALNLNLPIYTHNNSYISLWGQLYLVPEERIRDITFTHLYLQGVNEKNIDAFITFKDRFVRLMLFGYYKMRAEHCSHDCYSEEEINTIKKNYLDFYKNVNFEEFLKKYKIDYAVWDPRTEKMWNLDRYPFFTLVKEINGVKIYKVI